MIVKHRFSNLTALIVVLLTCISVAACSQSESTTDTQPEAKIDTPVEAPVAVAEPTTAVRNQLPAPPVMTSLAGETFSLASYEDRLVLLNFWATWCAPCRIEMPDLEELQHEFDENKFKVIGLAADEIDGVKEYLQTTPVSYPNYIGDPDEVFAWSERLGNRVVGVPFTALIDTTGTIRWTKMGGRISLEELAPIINQMLNEN